MKEVMSLSYNRTVKRGLYLHAQRILLSSVFLIYLNMDNEKYYSTNVPVFILQTCSLKVWWCWCLTVSAFVLLFMHLPDWICVCSPVYCKLGLIDKTRIKTYNKTHFLWRFHMSKESTFRGVTKQGLCLCNTMTSWSGHPQKRDFISRDLQVKSRLS